MSMLEGAVKTPFGEVSKKTAVLVGAGLLGLLGIMYYRSRQAKAASATAGANTGIDPATGYTYGTAEDATALAAQSSYITPTGGGGGGGGGTGNTGFTSNGQWAQAAEQYMQAEGLIVDASALSSALGKYITGKPASETDINLINQAIAFQGYPPVAGPSGYPPSINTAPVQPPPTDTTPPPTETPPTNTPPAPDTSPLWQNVYKGNVVDDWINASGKDWGTLLVLNPTDSRGQGLATNVSKSSNPRLRVFLYNTAYRIR